MARGCLTNEIKEKYNITLKQLRLLPYFQYLLMNESRLVQRQMLKILSVNTSIVTQRVLLKIKLVMKYLKDSTIERRV